VQDLSELWREFMRLDDYRILNRFYRSNIIYEN
jgi:hypothetical protein